MSKVLILVAVLFSLLQSFSLVNAVEYEVDPYHVYGYHFTNTETDDPTAPGWILIDEQVTTIWQWQAWGTEIMGDMWEMFNMQCEDGSYPEQWVVFYSENWIDASGVYHYTQYQALCGAIQTPTPSLPQPAQEIYNTIYTFDVFKLVCEDTPVSQVSTDGTAQLIAVYSDGSQERIGDPLTIYSDGSDFTVSAILNAGETFPEGSVLEIRTDRELLASFELTAPVYAHYQGIQIAVREGCYEDEGQ